MRNVGHWVSFDDEWANLAADTIGKPELQPIMRRASSTKSYRDLILLDLQRSSVVKLNPSNRIGHDPLISLGSVDSFGNQLEESGFLGVLKNNPVWFVLRRMGHDRGAVGARILYTENSKLHKL
jgi:hypothetical protein